MLFVYLSWMSLLWAVIVVDDEQMVMQMDFQ
jgi:hypothetical protein